MKPELLITQSFYGLLQKFIREDSYKKAAAFPRRGFVTTDHGRTT